MSGRDVRRLAAHAATQTHEAKRSIVARAALGADGVGVEWLHVMHEPFNIASRALKHLPLKAQIDVVKFPLRHSGADTIRAVEHFRNEGCEVLISLGGDGTNRVITQSCPDLTLLPLSTGTNNVFPIFAEPTNVGMAAALLADGRIAREDAAQRCKVLRLQLPDGSEDLALIDAVLMRPDHLGNVKPFEPNTLQQVILTRAHPDSVGMSPIGGLLRPVDASEDMGLHIKLGEAGKMLNVPVSPGLFGRVGVKDLTEMPLDTSVTLNGPGIIALDGDRLYELEASEHATVTLRRDGPWVANVEKAMVLAAQQGLFA
ncbi:MAG: NAD(+)/NADH kinase [Pseudomonadota bacterium]